MARRAAAPVRRIAPRLLLDLALMSLAFALAAPNRAGATVADPAAICLSTADRAADRHGVPRAVMRALTRTETGRARDGALQPWAWTVNMEGAGRWFDSRAEALAYVRQEQARGARSFDVGCFQINHRWHGENFDDVEHMFDPDANADYAARFVADLYQETRDWARAAGYYHSRTPEFYTRYRDRFARILARGDAETGPVQVAALDAAPPPAAQPLPDRAARRRAADPDRRAAPLLVSLADAPPSTAGAVPIRVLRGGLGILGGASRPIIGP
jgi:hypothetical protein